jgi:hypothetical protein
MGDEAGTLKPYYGKINCFVVVVLGAQRDPRWEIWK